jgi:pSer/pThr/pTyr-binding forkhead associated (FHA) protein
VGDVNAAVELIIRQPGHPDRVVRLPEGGTVLGRAEDVDIVLSDVGVSRKHARLVVERGAVRVEDLGSGNGSYVRGERVGTLDLRDGDEVVIDPFVLQVRIRELQRAEHTPQLQPRARLDVIVGPGLAHTTYPIPARGLTMGRSDTRDIVIPDPASSRHHCSIFLQQGQHVLRDMGSANGVFVNGARVEECVLRTGDVITIGNTELRYVFEDVTRQSIGQGAPAGPRPASVLERSPGITFSGTRTTQTAPSGAGTIASVLATVVFVIAIGVVGFLVVLFLGGDATPQPTTRPSGPPSWSLTLAAEPETLDPQALSRSGVALVKANDHRAALEKFWLLLRVQPGNEASERFAYAAGEHLVLTAIREELVAEEGRLAARATEREALLEAATRGDRSARRELERAWRDDPAVMDALSWPPSAVSTELQRRLGDAAEHASRGEWKQAAAVYDEVATAAPDPTLRRTARTGWMVAERELARAARGAWAAGVLAEAEGRVDEARARYEEALEIDPGNASARLRLDRLRGR